MIAFRLFPRLESLFTPSIHPSTFLTICHIHRLLLRSAAATPATVPRALLPQTVDILTLPIVRTKSSLWLYIRVLTAKNLQMLTDQALP